MPGTASLLPREHGAYAQLAFPLVTGIALAIFIALGQGGSPELAGPAAALLPPVLATFVLSIFRVHPKNLKRVGWSLVGANALALVLLLQG